MHNAYENIICVPPTWCQCDHYTGFLILIQQRIKLEFGEIIDCWIWVVFRVGESCTRVATEFLHVGLKLIRIKFEFN